MTEKLTESGAFAYDPNEVVFKGITSDYAEYQKKILGRDMDILRNRFLAVLDELSERQKESFDLMGRMSNKCNALQKAVDQGYVDHPEQNLSAVLWQDCLRTSGLLTVGAWEKIGPVERDFIRTLAERAYILGQRLHKEKSK
jgi:hypothetical protein